MTGQIYIMGTVESDFAYGRDGEGNRVVRFFLELDRVTKDCLHLDADFAIVTATGIVAHECIDRLDCGCHAGIWGWCREIQRTECRGRVFDTLVVDAKLIDADEKGGKTNE